MSPQDDPTADLVLELLVGRYGGATAARALWRWAGGHERDVDYVPAPDDLWRGLWARAGEGGEGVPTRFDLVREALFDDPGHPGLVEYLVDKAPLELMLDAVLLRELLERLCLCGLADAGLRPLVAAYPATRWEDAFAAVTPALQEWLGEPERERLAGALERVGGVAGALAELVTMRAAMRPLTDVKDDPDPDSTARQVAAAHARIVALAADAARWAAAPDADRLTRALAQALSRARGRGAPTARAISASLTSLFVTLKLGNDVDPVEQGRVAAVARGLEAAVWGSKPAKAPVAVHA